MNHVPAAAYADTPTLAIEERDARFVYRDIGPRDAVPVVLNHLGATRDNDDPRVVDGLAARHRVIAFDNRGVGASSGKTPETVAEMALDAVAFIRAMGFDSVDLPGFSLGGLLRSRSRSPNRRLYVD